MSDVRENRKVLCATFSFWIWEPAVVQLDGTACASFFHGEETNTKNKFIPNQTRLQACAMPQVHIPKSIASTAQPPTALEGVHCIAGVPDRQRNNTRSACRCESAKRRTCLQGSYSGYSGMKIHNPA